MSITNIIEIKFNGNQIVFVDSEYRLNSGMSLKFTDIDLPEAYQVHFANSLHGATFEAIGNADGVRIPDDVWTSKEPIFAWIYLHPTEDSAVTKYEVRIIKKIRADLPNGVEPTPYEQTVIDEAISALNTAVAQTAQDVIDADASAQSAAQSADFLRNASASATTLSPGSDASVTLADGEFSFGIPRGDKGEQGERGDKGDTGATGATPNLTIGTVETLPSSQDATATITGTAENPVLSLGIPKGKDGADCCTYEDTGDGDIVITQTTI